MSIILRRFFTKKLLRDKGNFVATFTRGKATPKEYACSGKVAGRRYAALRQSKVYSRRAGIDFCFFAVVQ